VVFSVRDLPCNVSLSGGFPASAIVTLGYSLSFLYPFAVMHEANAFSLKPLSLCAC